jgi:predicted nucleic acid-binding protein
MPVLVDTNILLRSAQPTHPLSESARRAVSRLIRNGETIFFCPQNITEFWCVATRPEGRNGLGFSHEEALQEMASIEALLTLLPDSPAVHPEWKRLVRDYRVQGLKTFDARLVAVMNVYGIRTILTLNAADFKRYSGIAIIDPGLSEA